LENTKGVSEGVTISLGSEQKQNCRATKLN